VNEKINIKSIKIKNSNKYVGIHGKLDICGIEIYKMFVILIWQINIICVLIKISIRSLKSFSK
jgi:hypothetical protein